MLYFAYGSNMDLTRMRNRCPSARFIFIAKANGFRLDFTRYSTTNRCGVADLVFDPPSSVWGVVYHILDEDIPALDKAEGVGVGAYKHFTVDVHPDGQRSQRISVPTYVVVTKEDPKPKPSAVYKAMIVDGATHWGLPSDYVAELKNIEVTSGGLA